MPALIPQPQKIAGFTFLPTDSDMLASETWRCQFWSGYVVKVARRRDGAWHIDIHYTRDSSVGWCMGKFPGGRKEAMARALIDAAQHQGRRKALEECGVDVVGAGMQ